jgi:hypothetical protein
VAQASAGIRSAWILPAFDPFLADEMIKSGELSFTSAHGPSQHRSMFALRSLLGADRTFGICEHIVARAVTLIKTGALKLLALCSPDDSHRDSVCYCRRVVVWGVARHGRALALQRRGEGLHRHLRQDQRSPQAFGLRHQLPGAAVGLPSDRLLGQRRATLLRIAAAVATRAVSSWLGAPPPPSCAGLSFRASRLGRHRAVASFRWVDFHPAGPIDVPVLFYRRLPSIAAFEERAGCGARQWHRVGAPGGAGPYVTGPARPKRQPLVTGDLPWRAADPGFGFANRRRSAGGASRRSIASCERDGKRETGRPGRPNSKPRDDDA